MRAHAVQQTNEQQSELKDTPKTTAHFSFPPKDEAWLNRKLQEYTALMGKSVDAEAAFVEKEKEWLAAMRIGRQSARDRFRAGMILLEMQKKMKEEIGFPFWRYLTAMEIPHKTAQRAIELAKFYKTGDSLGDNTITECYAEIKAAKAKSRVKHDEVDEDQHDDVGKIGREADTVSNEAPISTTEEDEEGTDDSEGWGRTIRLPDPNQDMSTLDARSQLLDLQQLYEYLCQTCHEIGLMQTTATQATQIFAVAKDIQSKALEIQQVVAQTETIPVALA